MLLTITRLSFVLALLIFCAPPRALSETCGTYDYSNQLGEVRDQQNADWCVGFVAADMITNFNYGRVRVSAFDTSWTGLMFGSGRLHERIEQIISEAYPDDDVDEYRAMFQNMYNHDYRGKTPNGRGGFDLFQTLLAYNAHAGMCSETQLPSERSPVFRNAANWVRNTVNAFARGSADSFAAPVLDTPLTGPSSFKDFYSEAKASALMQQAMEAAVSRVANKIDQMCSPRAKMRTMVPEQREDGNIPAMIATLKSVFRQKKIAGLTVSSCALTGEPSPSIMRTKAYTEKCNHEVSVVGQKWNPRTSRCEYKVRNSWGRSCALYAERFRAKCEAGYLYLNSNDLSDIHASHLTYLRSIR